MPKRGSNDRFKATPTKSETDILDKEFGIARNKNGKISIPESRKNQQMIAKYYLTKRGMKIAATPKSAEDIQEGLELLYEKTKIEFDEGREIPITPLEIMAAVGITSSSVRSLMYDPRYIDEKRGINVLDEAMSKSASDLSLYALKEPKTSQMIMFMLKAIYPETFNERYELIVKGQVNHTFDTKNMPDDELIEQYTQLMNKIQLNKAEYEVK